MTFDSVGVLQSVTEWASATVYGDADDDGDGSDDERMAKEEFRRYFVVYAAEERVMCIVANDEKLFEKIFFIFR